ncbi:MAG: hypothetical protein JWL83_3561 [Actinomycetia bacterium]|nr:hypothetical protein [Actinomycetes bacterium]
MITQRSVRRCAGAPGGPILVHVTLSETTEGLGAGSAGPASTRSGRVVAVTAAHDETAKRGLASGIARALARGEDQRVCVLAADATSRDVKPRFEDGCWIASLGAAGAEVDPSEYARIIRGLRGCVDYIVIDAPIGFAVHARRIDRMVHFVDELLVATNAQSMSTRALVHYVNAITRGRVTGAIPGTLEVRVVPTGAESDDDDVTASLSRKLGVVPVAQVVPSLWGRNASRSDDLSFVPETLEQLIRELAAGA